MSCGFFSEEILHIFVKFIPKYFGFFDNIVSEIFKNLISQLFANSI